MSAPKFLIISLLLLFWASCQHTHFVKQQNKFTRINADVKEDSLLNVSLAGYKQQVDAKMGTIIGNSTMQLTKMKPESTLGNFVADALLAQAKLYTQKNIDFAIANYGGLRLESLPKGEWTQRYIFELLPFDNTVVVVELKGSDVQLLMDYAAGKGGVPASVGLRCVLGKDGKAKQIFVHDKLVEADKTYVVATIDYLANGGDDCSFFLKKPRTETGVFVRDAVTEYVQQLTKNSVPIEAKVEGRMKIE